MPSAEAVRRVAVVTHERPETIGGAVERLEETARRHGVEVAHEPDGADLVVVLGGDGTMLRALAAFLDTGVPVLGVNFGRVGFLSAVEGPDLEAGLERAFAGDYDVIELPTLQCEAGGVRGTAVNDVVAHSAGVGRMVEIGWEVGGESLGTFRCDGVICSTPSGSTAYNLSSGGPVLVWGLEAMAVTFVAPHSLKARPLVVPRGREVVVRNLTPNAELAVTVDGKMLCELAEGGDLRVRLDGGRALLATLPEHTFFRRFREHFAS